MKLAYFSPLNPIASGISDYSEELLPHLAAYADLTLVVDRYTPTNRELVAKFQVIDQRAYRARDFDLALYQLGNSPAHAYIYQRALAEPGVIVLHDLVLHHLVAWLTLERGDKTGYLDAMRAAYGDEGMRLATRELSGVDALDRFHYPLSEPVAQKSRGVIVHSHFAADAVQRAAPNIPVAQIPHELPNIQPIDPKEARRKLNLPQDALLVGSFGNLAPSKRITVLLDAFRAVQRTVPDARLVFVGGRSPNFDMDGLVAQFDMQNSVQVLGHVPMDAFQTYIAAMDVCVNLRYPTTGETSGAVLRMMAQRKPVIVSRVGWFAELPDNAIAKIDVDDQEILELRVMLEQLLRDPTLREAMGSNAREYVVQTCAVEEAARDYADFMQAVVAGHAESKVYERGRTEGGGQSTEHRARTTDHRLSTPDDIQATVHRPPSTVSADWRAEVARAYTSLGLNEEDTVLREVAGAVVELGLGE